jgi:hypothetical protein
MHVSLNVLLHPLVFVSGIINSSAATLLHLKGMYGRVVRVHLRHCDLSLYSCIWMHASLGYGCGN